MKYTPLDIQRREFGRTFRGLDEDEIRTFLHEVAGEWEELLHENQKLREEIVDLRERLRQYQDQERIFRETLLNAQRSKEDLLDAANREKSIILKETSLKAEEMLRDAQVQVARLESEVRGIKLTRIRFLQEIDAVVARTRRFLQDEAPEMFPPAEPTRKLNPSEVSRIDELLDGV